MSKRVEEIVRKLTVMDDILFYKLAENKNFCEELLQVSVKCCGRSGRKISKIPTDNPRD